jgi:hypothetical protein
MRRRTARNTTLVTTKRAKETPQRTNIDLLLSTTAHDHPKILHNYSVDEDITLRQLYVAGAKPTPSVEIPCRRAIELPTRPALELPSTSDIVTMPPKAAAGGNRADSAFTSSPMSTPSPANNRSMSVELGDGDFAVQYNSKTGRPIRKSANKRDLGEFVDVDAIDDVSDEEPMSSSEEEAILGIGDKAKNSKRKGAKANNRRKLKPAPPEMALRSLSPKYPSMDYEEAGDLAYLRDDDGFLQPDDSPAPTSDLASITASNSDATLDTLNLTINIPAGFQGPLRLEVPRSVFALNETRPAKRLRASQSHSEVSQPTKAATHQASRAQSLGSLNNKFVPSVGGKGDSSLFSGKPQPIVQEETAAKPRCYFLEAPGEVRNIIYRKLLVAGVVLDLSNPRNFTLSGQLLRTCRQIHEDARSILYGENKFQLERTKGRRQKYWQPDPQDIGWKDVRHFLSDIGETNISLMREVIIVCEDALPSLAPLLSKDARRFVYDPNLGAVMGTLARHTNLRHLKLCFAGRKMLSRQDENFLKTLVKIKADSVKVGRHTRWNDPYLWGPPHESKVEYGLTEQIELAMTRKTKLYNEPARIPTQRRS